MNQTVKQNKEVVTTKENYLKFLSIIAHNVKGPVKYMGFITDYTLSNWNTLEPADIHECAKVINESAKNIAEQLGNLLSWARLQDGSFVPNIRPFSLLDSLRDEIRLQGPIAKMKEITIEEKIASDILINSDSNLFNLAFHNIYTNAIKFTNKGGKISIDAKIHKDMLILRVIDNGVGMTPAELALIYDDKSFSNPGTINEHGTGFGLHIASEILVLLNGNIEVDSELNKGTSVSICVPV